MTPPDQAPNPERRSDAAILCLCIGFALLGLSWLLGLGGVLAAIVGGVGGEAGAAVAGGLAAMILLPIAGVLGFLFVLVGGIWLFIQVVADQRSDHARERYSREVER